MADAAAGPTLFTLPAHLRERIAALVEAAIAPAALQADLCTALEAAEYEEWEEAFDDGSGAEGADGSRNSAVVKEKPPLNEPKDADDGGADAPPAPPPPIRKPPTIDGDVLDRLGAWAASPSAGDTLRAAHLDPNEYGPIALVAGTEVYLPPRQRALARAAERGLVAREKINPYLPAYMSPAPPSFGREYRALSRDLATAANVLFSIAGVAGAAYVAATTGAGWSREHAVLLAIAAGFVTGVADAGLIYIFKIRATKARREKAARRVRLNKGSAGIPGSARVLALGDEEGDALAGDRAVLVPSPAQVDADAAASTAAEPAQKRTLRLRRKPLE